MCQLDRVLSTPRLSLSLSLSVSLLADNKKFPHQMLARLTDLLTVVFLYFLYFLAQNIIEVRPGVAGSQLG